MGEDVIISVEGLGKRYRLGAGGSSERYTALRDVLAEKAKLLFRRTSDQGPQPSTLNPQPSTLNPQPSTLNPQPSTLNHQPAQEEFWALRDVSFEVKQGEVIGLIGRNSERLRE